MRALVPIAVGVLCAGSVAAQTVLPTRTLRAGTQITAADLALTTDPTPLGAVANPEEAIGLEARVTLYAGRAIPVASLGPPALIERNDLVRIVVRRGGLTLHTDGRALGRGAEGDEIRVMNTASRNTVSGLVAGPGLIEIP